MCGFHFIRFMFSNDKHSNRKRTARYSVCTDFANLNQDCGAVARPNEKRATKAARFLKNESTL
jgi:hypothetical protein